MTIKELVPRDELSIADADALPGDPALAEVAQDLFDTLNAIPHCLGLTAPQIGSPLRLLAFDLYPRHENRPLGPLVILNPQIVASDGESVRNEICFSLGGTRKHVTRPERVFLKGLSITGAEVRTEAAGLEARVLQHLIDHLRGVTFDRL
ncbi:MAG TPA: peptide deformylase [Actinomycetota bacterium]|nr:peptide deformylase [Actinomycetota bacterium]